MSVLLLKLCTAVVYSHKHILTYDQFWGPAMYTDFLCVLHVFKLGHFVLCLGRLLYILSLLRVQVICTSTVNCLEKLVSEMM